MGECTGGGLGAGLLAMDVARPFPMFGPEQRRWRQWKQWVAMGVLFFFEAIGGMELGVQSPPILVRSSPFFICKGFGA